MINTKRLKRYSNEIKYNYFKKRYIIYTFLITIIVCGLLIGNIINKNMDISQQSFFKNYIDNYFENFKTENYLKNKLILESIFKYGKSIITIWLLGFMNIGFLLTIFILILKFISLSLVTSFFIKYYYLKGLLYAFILYIPQNLILIPIYLYISYYSIKFNFKNRSISFRGSFLEYFLILLIAISCIFLISLYEVFITPRLFNYIISFKK